LNLKTTTDNILSNPIQCKKGDEFGLIILVLHQLTDDGAAVDRQCVDKKRHTEGRTRRQTDRQTDGDKLTTRAASEQPINNIP